MKTKTESVEAAALEVMQGGTDPSLSDYEQRLYWELVAEMREGKYDIDGELWRLDYVKKPPSMEQFLMDDEYLGRTWKPVEGENEGIWPAWHELMVNNLDLESRIHNMVITGSLGIGKTVLMVTILLYRICVACHLKNPQNFFGLNKNTNIVYNFLSITKTAVKETGFGDAMSFMGDSPFFVEFCGFDPESDYSGFRIPMRNLLPNGRPSRIWVTGGSKGHHVIGRNLLGIGLDEGNFRLEKDPDLKAYALYDEVRTRISNRFQKIASYLPAISIIASSAHDESSFTEKIVAEIEEHNRKREEENAKILDPESKMPVTESVFRHAVYKIKRHTLPGIGPNHHWFRVAYGLKNMDPYLLSGWYKEDGTPILDDPHEEPAKGAKTELAPKFYWDAFKRNAKTALQNLSGISVGGAHRLFSSLLDIEICLKLSKEEHVPDPMLPGVGHIPISAEDSLNVWDSLNHKAFLTRVASRIQPIRHPQNLRYAHIDLATQTMAGVSICHLAGAQLVEGLVKDGEPFSEYRLMTEYDFILTLIAGATKPINIEKIQRFFYWLRDMCGYRFGLITADVWNSAAPLQAMEARGFKVDVLSIDRDKNVYHSWRTGFEEHRMRLYRNEQMIREAEQLLEMDKKFDHPGDGSKDTTDACFVATTKITTLAGKTIELGSLKPGQKCWVYSLDEKLNVVAAQGCALGTTRKDAKIIHVYLDNGSKITCTPDHKLMLRDGTYIEAGHLTVGSSLMPFYFGRTAKGYGKIFNPARNRYEKVYNIIDRQFNGERPTGYTVHHKDLTKRNDQPDNLERMTNAAHWALHRHINNPVGWLTEKKRQRALASYNQRPETKIAAAKRVNYARLFSKDRTAQIAASLPRILSVEFRKKHSAFMRKRMADPYTRQHQSAALIACNKQKTILIAQADLVALRNADFTNKEIAEKYSVSESLIERRIRAAKQAGLVAKINYTPRRATSFKIERKEKLSKIEDLRNHGKSIRAACARANISPTTYYAWLSRLNHKVTAIRNAGYADVTCLRVPTHENFALASGIFVHNCSGAHWNAINSEECIAIGSHNLPSIYTSASMQPDPTTQVPISIPLPAKGYDRSKLFNA